MLFGTAFLTGHYDIHGGNVGIRTDGQDKKYFALIDFGRGLSYNMETDWSSKRLVMFSKPQTAEKFKQRMLEGGAIFRCFRF